MTHRVAVVAAVVLSVSLSATVGFAQQARWNASPARGGSAASSAAPRLARIRARAEARQQRALARRFSAQHVLERAEDARIEASTPSTAPAEALERASAEHLAATDAVLDEARRGAVTPATLDRATRSRQSLSQADLARRVSARAATRAATRASRAVSDGVTELRNADQREGVAATEMRLAQAIEAREAATDDTTRSRLDSDIASHTDRLGVLLSRRAAERAATGQRHQAQAQTRLQRAVALETQAASASSPTQANALRVQATALRRDAAELDTRGTRLIAESRRTQARADTLLQNRQRAGN